MGTNPTRMNLIQASGSRFIRKAGAEGLSHWRRCPNGAQDSAPGDQPWVFAWETGISSSPAHPEHDRTTTPRQLRIQRSSPRHAMEGRECIKKSQPRVFRPPASHAKAKRRTAQAMERTARHRETPSAATSEPNGTQSKTQRANPFGDARRPLHHGPVQQPLPLKSGSDLTDLVHTLCGPIQS